MYKPTTFVVLLLTLLSIVSAALFGKDDKSLFDILVTDKRFTTFLKHIEEAELTSAFKNIKAGTIFAPVNEAFDDHKLIAQRQLKSENILYHVVPFISESGDLWDGRVLQTEAKIDKVDQFVKISKSTITRTITLGPDNGLGEAKVTEKDIKATNGVIHAIDHLLPLPVYLGKFLTFLLRPDFLY